MASAPNIVSRWAVTGRVGDSFDLLVMAAVGLFMSFAKGMGKLGSIVERGRKTSVLGRIGILFAMPLVWSGDYIKKTVEFSESYSARTTRVLSSISIPQRDGEGKRMYWTGRRRIGSSGYRALLQKPHKGLGANKIYESKICKEHVQIAKPHSDRSPQVTYSLDIHYTSDIEGNLLIAIGWQLGAWRLLLSPGVVRMFPIQHSITIRIQLDASYLVHRTKARAFRNRQHDLLRDSRGYGNSRLGTKSYPCAEYRERSSHHSTLSFQQSSVWMFPELSDASLFHGTSFLAAEDFSASLAI
ncbi:uncharacterized protein BO96DRAFT_399936 [Aspergillus niger CBS 101883]|uniref:Uncharacterized protein n=2 Tax=Aspergillus niger TaxID=5061 RepID=A2QP84_ASPNC|nr:uncharacterized protein BO96DRAFT_399936 [Aspergillus niger CBS 101883]XP_059601055.1 hypothetical protein An07g08550 [Aspergillus niger]PYH53420.1 hypothetical protein BO96DRAFT_399936 [Aspergillus niger CBS 101883]CAK39649.1 hypothetical protein An07g08550 [Aspergillus niger]